MNLIISAVVTNDLSFDQRMHRICSTLSENGYTVTLTGRKKRDSLTLKQQSFNQKRLSCLFEKGFLFYLEFNMRSLLWLLFNKQDIICSVDLDTLPACFVASKIKGIRLVYDSHELFCETPEIASRKRIHTFWSSIEKILLPKIKYGYTVNQSISDIYNKKFNINLKVIRNVRPLEIIQNQSSKHQTTTIIYIGAVNKGRGLEILLDQMKHIPANLHICGYGDILEKIKERVKVLGLQEKVKVFGAMSPRDLMEETKRCHIGYHMLEQESMSYYYSLGNKFFDYMHAGIPQVTIDFPEYRIINESIEVSLLTKYGFKDIREAAIKLIEDEKLYKKLSQGAEKAREIYCWENESKKLIQFYRQLNE